ncbi:MAG: hypothetical protein LBT04_03070 [Prevotellaceae bacterium]|jgi:hypothetical protein|nr:hypothetical protein [Prevotellaceae bacterium]
MCALYELHIMNAYIVPIGKIILNKLAEERRTVSWLAKNMGCDRSAVYKMLKKSSIDIVRLYQISKIMKVDFFRYYSEALARIENQQSKALQAQNSAASLQRRLKVSCKFSKAVPASRLGMLRPVEKGIKPLRCILLRMHPLRDAGWDAGKFHSTERSIPTE